MLQQTKYCLSFCNMKAYSQHSMLRVIQQKCEQEHMTEPDQTGMCWVIWL